MTVNIGDTPQAGFDEPLKLMSDCHRRVERFLGMLLEVARRRGGALDEAHRSALTAGLRYFRNAAPWHTQDEEASLFPRLRRCGDAQAKAAMSRIDALEADHADAAPIHAEVETLATRWLEAGRLGDADADLLLRHLTHLQGVYARHIAVEDHEIFPLAQRLLSHASLQAVGREMADRRGLDPGLPPRRCRHRLTTRRSDSARKGT